MLKTIKLFPLFVLFLLPFGCTQTSVPVIPSHDSPSISVTEPQLEEADLECSYFYFLWGRYAELSAHFEEALEAYEKALICDPSADFIARKVPVLLLRLNRDREAGTYLQHYLSEHPDDTGGRFLLAKILIRQQAYGEAAIQYQTIHRQNPGEIQALLLLSELHLAQGQFDAARDVLLDILTVSEDSYPAHVLLARIYAQNNQVPEALEHYRQALDLNWSLELELEVSELYLKHKRYPEAEELLTQLVSRESSSEEVSIALVNAYLLQKKEDAALAELHRLKTLSSNPERVEVSIARIYARRKQYTRAADILKGVLEQENLPQAHYLLGVLYFQLKHHEEALGELQQIPAGAETYEDSLFLRVRLLRILERPIDAIALLQDAVDSGNVTNVDLYVLLATLYQVQGKGDQGAATFTAALVKYPDNDTLLYEYGLFLEQRGEQQQALSVMQRVLAVKPDHAAALNYIGYTWADSSTNLDQALEYIQRAVELDPENGYIRDSLGWVLYRLGHLEQAMQELEKAVKLSRDDPAILDHLGDVYLEAGLFDKALQVYRRALELYTEKQDKARVQEKIHIVETQDL